MGWDTNLDFTGYSPSGSAKVPDDDYIAEIADTQLGDKEGVGAKVTFSLKILEGEYRGQVIRISPYIPGKDFKGSDGQKNWALGVWHDIIAASGASPDKVKGKPAEKVAKALVGKKVVITTETSAAKQTPADVAAGAKPREFCNIRSFRVYVPSNAPVEAPALTEVPEPNGITESSPDDDGDEFSLDALA